MAASHTSQGASDASHASQLTASQHASHTVIES